jgi:hypothetical protein
MARTAIIMNNPTFRLATTQAGLTAGTAYECQLTQAIINAIPNFTTIPATACAPATQSPGKTGWELAIDFLQDWTASLGGLSGFMYTNDTKPMWFELVVDSAVPAVKATGQVYLVSGSYGGPIGTGDALAASATLPCLDKPVIVFPAVLVADDETADDTDAAA